MTRILVCDDDPGLREILGYALTRQGWEVEEAHDGAQALAKFSANPHDLIVLDVMMPELDGVEVCRQIRRSSQVPIVFLSALDEEIDRVLGLEMGGDDYITKPFSPRELVARVKGMLRRRDWAASADAQATTPLTHGRLTLDPATHRVIWDGQEAVLTVTEFGLLRALMSRPGEVMGREDLMQTAYDLGRIVSERTIDSHIRRVRRKLGGEDSPVVETVRGLGYKLGPC